MAPRTFGLAPETPMLDDYKAAFDAHLDSVARQKLYDDRLSIVTWVDDANPTYAAEAAAFKDWRSKANTSMFAQLAAVQAGGVAPTIAEFIAELQVIIWP